MKKAIFSGVVLLMLVAVGFGAWWYWPIYQIELDVKSRLNDPESARFSDVSFNRTKRTGCGFVNAKNRMGGYIGKTHFIIFPDGDLRFEPSDDGYGDPERRIESLQKRINYLTLVDSNCNKMAAR
jgi:hypothetical protein